MDVWMIPFLIVLCLLVEAFFAGSEIAVVSADRLRLRHLAAKGNHGAQLALQMLQKPEHLLTTTLVGINVAIVTNASLSTAFVIELLGQEMSWVAILVSAPLIWVFGEIVPKTIFQQKADVLAPRIIYVLKVASLLFFPLIVLFSYAFKLISAIFGLSDKASPFTLRDEIDMVLQLRVHESDILPMEKNMIRRMFNFGETKVRGIMVPLIDVRSLEWGVSCGQAMQEAREQSHLLFPVYADRVDNIVGYVNTVHLLGVADGHPIRPSIKPIRFIPGSKSIEELLNDFQRDGDSLAMVVDEYGSCEGMVSLEDILERVVGEMRDEYDVEKTAAVWWKKLESGSFLVNARMPLVAMRDELNIVLPEGNYETLSGFLLDRFRNIPTVGEIIIHDGVEFVVTKSGRHAIQEVRVSKLSIGGETPHFPTAHVLPGGE